MADIVIQLLPHILAALIYGALGFHFWNTRWREVEGQCVACPMQTWERSAIALALVIHAVGLYDALFTEAGMRFSFSFALSLMMWLAVLIYWLESFMARMEGMQPMVLPLAAGCAVLPVIFPNVHLVAHASDAYIALFSWNELLNTSVGDGVLVVYAQHGQPLPPEVGHIALVSGCDRHPGPRHVKWLKAIELKTVPL